MLEAEKSQGKEKRLTKPECLSAPRKEDAESWDLQSIPLRGQADDTSAPAPQFFPYFTIFFNREVIHLVRNATHLPNQVAGSIQGNRSPRPLLVGVLTHRLQGNSCTCASGGGHAPECPNQCCF